MLGVPVHHQGVGATAHPTPHGEYGSSASGDFLGEIGPGKRAGQMLEFKVPMSPVILYLVQVSPKKGSPACFTFTGLRAPGSAANIAHGVTLSDPATQVLRDHLGGCSPTPKIPMLGPEVHFQERAFRSDEKTVKSRGQKHKSENSGKKQPSFAFHGSLLGENRYGAAALGGTLSNRMGPFLPEFLLPGGRGVVRVCQWLGSLLLEAMVLNCGVTPIKKIMIIFYA
jgi:hypothetical protein